MSEGLSEATVKNLPIPAKGSRVHYFKGDKIQGKQAPSGFGVRCTCASKKSPSGKKSFVLNYRNREGTERRFKIGVWPDWTVIKALIEAKELRQQIDKGDDPQADKKKTRTASTVADLCDIYIKEYLPGKRPASRRDDNGMIKGIIRPKLGKKKIENLRKSDIRSFHQSMKDRPFRANRSLALLSTMFNFAINDLEWTIENKAKGVKRFQEVKRERYLNPSELIRLTEALADLPEVWAAKEAKRRGPNVNPQTVEIARRRGKAAADVVRVCMLTGCRSGEALQATREQFTFAEDMDGNPTCEWIKPGATTKQKTRHRVPLSIAATTLIKDILAAAPRGDDGKLESRFVFPGDKADAPLSQVKYEWEYLRKAANIPDVRLHDLRHTYASILVSAGQSLPIVGALLGHTNPLTTLRYSHLMDDPLKKATDTVGHIVTGTKPADVTPIRKDGAA